MVPSSDRAPGSSAIVTCACPLRVAVILFSLVLNAHPLFAQPACGAAEPTTATGPTSEASGATDRSVTPTPANETGDRADSHMFGVLPNYSTVERSMPGAAITANQKFRLATLNTFDPYVFPFEGVVATLNHSYGPGVGGFLKQYPAALTDNAVGNFLTTGVLPSVLHQDPRYYERGSGTFLGRVAYAASRSVVTRSDAGHPQFNVSEIGGNAVAAGLSNLYYPAADRTMTATLSRWGMQVMWDALSNELKEFWPDVRNKLRGQ